MPDSSADAEAGAPRWVKVLGLVAAALVLVFVVVQVVSGGEHGPGRHGGGDGTPPTTIADGGDHAPPAGVDHGGEP